MDNSFSDQTILDTPAMDPEYDRASKTVRFTNYILDLVCYMIFSFIVGIILGLVGLGDSITEMNDSLLSIAFYLLYYLIFEGSFATTPGKMITGTRVVMEDGTKPAFGKILGRTFARIIPFEQFSGFSDSGPWHDQMTGTLVIKVRK